MTKRFESNKDLQREKNAIDAFLGSFNLSAKKLGPHDIDYEIFNNVGKAICYAEVKGRLRDIKDAYPLPIAARKLVKLSDKDLAGIVIWACNDGIIFGDPSTLKGDVRYGGRSPRPGAANDREIMVYYSEQENLKWKTISSKERTANSTASAKVLNKLAVCCEIWTLENKMTVNIFPEGSNPPNPSTDFMSWGFTKFF